MLAQQPTSPTPPAHMRMRIASLLQTKGVPVRRIYSVLEPLQPGEPIEVLYLTTDARPETAFVDETDEVWVCDGW